jgi:hypothetical protein
MYLIALYEPERPIYTREPLRAPQLYIYQRAPESPIYTREPLRALYIPESP